MVPSLDEGNRGFLKGLNIVPSLDEVNKGLIIDPNMYCGVTTFYVLTYVSGNVI